MIGIPAVELIGFDPSNFHSSQEWDFVAKQDEDSTWMKNGLFVQGVLVVSIRGDSGGFERNFRRVLFWRSVHSNAVARWSHKDCRTDPFAPKQS